MEKENSTELLQRFRRDRWILLNFILSGSLIKKVVMPPGAVSLDDVDLDQICCMDKIPMLNPLLLHLLCSRLQKHVTMKTSKFNYGRGKVSNQISGNSFNFHAT